MDLEMTHCVIVAGGADYIEKPGTVSISGGTIRIDDFVVICNEKSVNEIIRQFVLDRLRKV